MPARRELTMRQLRQMLRLHDEGVSAREIGRRLGVARSTIQDNLERAKRANVTCPLDAAVTDEMLEERLFAKAGFVPGVRRRIELNWAELARDMKRPGVNLMILWEEYRAVHPEGYAYSRYVAAKIMLRLLARARGALKLGAPQRGPIPERLPGSAIPRSDGSAWL